MSRSLIFGLVISVVFVIRKTLSRVRAGCLTRENLRTENGIKEKEKTDNHDNYAALQAKWSETINGLKQQLNKRSLLCEHVKNATEVKEHCPPIKTS
ncbi:uncharacterized protein si:ch73-347e22.8 isoform X2 [Xyrauchen texanus]|uniref:uncharacterized protein si:ch73-347e22.8 isoform X2 n=1 Tax=Xyrauchen texanus TaxID=154827 RepID=UPI002242B18B|nr:uncharacterized protein si:ch73-347e22.8 isoform X2 [Xyrauchen texanus]